MLSELNDQLHLLIDSVKDYAILMLDTEGFIMTWHAGAENIKGYTQDEILGKHFSIFYTDKDQSEGKPEELLKKAEKYGSAVEEGWRVRKGGNVFWGEINVTSIKSDDGKLIGYTKVTRDLSERKNAEFALRESEQKFKMVIEATPNALILANSRGTISLINSEAEKIFGYTRDELMGKSIELLVPPEFRKGHLKQRQGFHKSPVRREMGTGRDIYGRHKNGNTIPIEIGLNPIQTPEGDFVLASIIDITARKRAEEQIRLSACVYENTSEGIVITDRQSKILDVNKAYCEITGYSREELIGKDPGMNKSGRHNAQFYDSIWASVENNGHWVGEIWDRRKNGELFPQWLSINAVYDKYGKLSNYIGIFTDITPLKAAESELSQMAFYDSLTSLPNRTLFRDRLEQEIADCKRYNRKFGLMFIDLDRFKYVNDTLGHTSGDLLLVEVAKILKKSLRTNDTVARWGGDEFTIILTDLHNPLAAADIAQSIIKSLSQPIKLSEIDVFVGASIGISLFPEDGSDFETLTKNADVAMYQAKDSGRNTFQFFTEAMNQRSSDRLILENRLHKALQRKEFCVFYQPQIETKSGKIVGAEALIRWKHPEYGIISPLDFIPLAEENGLILPIGEWVFTEVCEQISCWNKKGLPQLRIAVNLSPRQFRQSDLASTLKKIIHQKGVNPSSLEIEITEGTVLEISDASMKVLDDLSKMGITIAIDDFGTGYSSLSYLKRLPVHKLKIDRSFVADIPDDPNDAAIAIAIIQLARSLGLQVVAEGVETDAQRQFMLENGCDFLQGSRYSMPMDVKEFETYLLSF